ncbi:MAG: ABC transporter ATP-binding protein [Oscillospiraceae bacterium]
MNDVITISELALTYQSAEGEIEAISNVSFSVEQGEFVSLIGPSGCGKSTLLSILAGLLAPTGGRMSIQNGDSIGYMLQKDSLFPWRTIRQNVLLGLDITGRNTPKTVAYADQLLSTYGLSDFGDSFPGQLSGGMRQRCALIRTLVVRPTLLLLDEPFSALDYQTRLAVSDDIRSIIRHEGKTALMVTHDISEAVSMSDRVIVLTKRPAMVKSIYPIVWADGPGSPLECREREEFRGYFNQIWRDIDVHL